MSSELLEENVSMKRQEEASSLKCANCSRKARKGCIRYLCLKCCTDDACTVHKDQRDQARFREHVLSGTTEVQKALQEKRSKLLPKGRFRESGFQYMGDTVVIWNVREYLANPKWKQDALRKSSKRRARSEQTSTPKEGEEVVKNSRKRFHAIMQQKYEQSLE